VDPARLNAVLRARASAATLPRVLFRDPRVFDLEMERLFPPAWHCVGRVDEFRVPGGTGTIEHVGESWTVSNDDGGWLASATESGGALRRLTVQPWRGFLFVALEPRASLPEALGPFAARAAPYPLERLRPVRRLWYDIRANWKLILENAAECYHCPGVHPQLVRVTPYLSGEDESLEGPAIGGWMELADGRTSLTPTGRSARRPFSGLGEEERRRVYYWSLFPLNFFSLTPDYVTLDRFVPLGPERTRLMFDVYVDADEADPAEDAIAFWDVTNRQDWHVCELAALGARTTAFTQGRYTELESMVHAVDRYYVRTMGLAGP
jgi:Rieske 2Fe-2S family protein